MSKAIKKDGKWTAVRGGADLRRSKKFHTNEESRLITQKRETNIPFTTWAQEFDIRNWFNTDQRTKEWSLKPEYSDKYEFIKDSKGKITGIREKSRTYKSVVDAEDDEPTRREYSSYIPYQIDYTNLGLLNQERAWSLYRPIDKDTYDSSYRESSPYLSLHKEWWQESPEVMDFRSLRDGESGKIIVNMKAIEEEVLILKKPLCH